MSLRPRSKRRMTQYEKGYITGIQRVEGMIRSAAEAHEFEKKEFDLYELAASAKRIWWNLQIEIYNRSVTSK